MTNDQQIGWQEYIEINQSAIVKRLIAARERYGLKQEWVAEKAGYSITQYIRIETGERKLDHEDIYRISSSILEYADSLKTPFQRKWIKIKTQINDRLYHLQGFLEESVPGMDAVFQRISLRHLMARLLICLTAFLFLGWTRITWYDVGAFFAKFCIWGQLILE